MGLGGLGPKFPSLVATAEYDVCTVHRTRARSGGRASWPFPGAGTAVRAGTIRWLTVLLLSVGFERDSSAVVLCAIGFTIEYLVSSGATIFCLFITLTPAHQSTGLFSGYPAVAFVICLTQSRRLPADMLRAGQWS